MARATRRPAEPTTSPTKRIARKGGTLEDRHPTAHNRVWMEAADGAGAGTCAAAPVVVPRWIQAVTLPLAILGGYALLRAAGPVTLIFVVAALVALLLNPFVALLQERARFPRGLAVLTVYLALIVIVGGLVAVLAEPIGDQAAEVHATRCPGVVDDANARARRSCSAGSTTTASTSRSPPRARPRSRRSARAWPRARASSSRSPARRCRS